MTRRNRILTAVAAAVAVILLLMAVLPFFFRDRIMQRVKTAVNQSVNARVDWRRAGLGFFRHFPSLTLTLDSLTVVGAGRFENDTLAAVRHFGVSLGLGSVIGNALHGSPLVVRSVEIAQPRLALIVLEDGTANWDITKKTPPQQAPPSKPLAVSLNNLQIADASLSYDDRKSKLSARLVGFHESLSGDFAKQQVAINTRTHADTATVTFAGITYLDKVQLGLDADVQADLAKKLYTLTSTKLSLNDLEVSVSGAAKQAGPSTALDLALNAPSTSFKSILSLVPAVWAHDFEKVKTSGTFTLDGHVKGVYGPNTFPAFALATKVSDASFQYPDLPLPARDIAFDLALTNPGGSPDSTVVNLSRFHVVLGQNPVDARLVMRTPVSDPDVDLAVNGRVDLADLRRTVKLQGIEQLAGTVAANASVRARVSAVKANKYQQLSASGTVDLANVTVKGATLPHPMTIQQASLALTPQRAQVKSFTGTIGSSDLAATGRIDNLVGWMFAKDTLRGSATLKSNRFNLDEWRSGSGDLQTIPVPPKLDFTLDAAIATLTYDKLTMTNAHGRVVIRDQRATLDHFTMDVLGGQIALTGYYDTKDPANPRFDVTLNMVKLNIPQAYQAFATVQALAPVARYASGQFTTGVHVSGGLGKNMMPLLPGLTGNGTLETTQLAIQNFPPLAKMASVTKLNFLNNPTMQALKTSFTIANGRLSPKPFDVKVGGITMNVSGSNGLDQSLAYTFGLTVPRATLGTGANDVLANLTSKAQAAGLNLAAAPTIPLAIQLGGTVTNPTVSLGLSSAASSVTSSVKEAATTKLSAEAQKLVADAEQRAATIRQDAQTLADKVKAEGHARADSLEAKAGDNPLLKVATKAAADKIRQQADDKSATIVKQANQRADSLVAAARRQAEKVGKP